MTAIPFRSLRAENLTLATIHDLMRWIADLVQVTVPSNGIEYWNDGAFFSENRETLAEACAKVGGRQRAAACYVHRGNNEGLRINVSLTDGEKIKSLGSAKTFGSRSESWQIAAIVGAAMEQILGEGQQPLIVEYARAVPRRHSSLTSGAKASSLALKIEGGKAETFAGEVLIFSQVVERRWGEHDVDALVHDWGVVATFFGLQLAIERDAPLATATRSEALA